MKLYSNNIHQGYLDDVCGHRGGPMFKNKKPTHSFHLGWKALPVGTKTLALVFIDYDAIPVCGFPWIHWTVANIDPIPGELTENASVTQSLLEGVTSWSSGLLPEEWKLAQDEDMGYGGCAPPDKTHVYQVEVYALDTFLALKRGFYLNELLHAIEGHVLEKTALKFRYKPR